MWIGKEFLLLFIISCNVVGLKAIVYLTILETSPLEFDVRKCGNDPITQMSSTTNTGNSITASLSPSSGFSVTTSELNCNRAVIEAAGIVKYVLSITMTSGADTVTKPFTVIFKNLDNTLPYFGAITNPIVVNTDHFETDTNVPIYTVNVNDDDGGKEGDVDITLAPGSDSRFRINNNNDRKIMAAKSLLGFADNSNYELKVVATDRGSPAMSATATLTLEFNVRARILDPPNGKDITICEIDPAGTTVYTLNVYGPVTATVASTPDIFEVDGLLLKLKEPTTGTLKDAINYEVKKGILPFTIQLSVPGDTKSVNIYIEDHNDFTPTFIGTTTSAVIKDTIPGGTSILTVTASDGDGSAPNNQFTYSLSGTGSGKFTLNANNGVLTVASGAVFNYTEASSYTLTVTATDKAPAPDTLSSTKTITITLETAPTFDVLFEQKTITIPEDHSISDPIYIVGVTDLDSKPQPLSYTINSQTSGDWFTLQGNKVYSNKPFDAEVETQRTFQLDFKVTDGKFEVASKSLFVTIEDVNDNTPVLTPSSPPKVEIIETAVTGVVGGTFSATDADWLPPNNVVNLTLSGGDNTFEVNTTSGAIQLVNPLNYTRQQSYNLIVTATDNGIPPRSSSVTLSVTVLTGPSFDWLSLSRNKTIPEDFNIANALHTIRVSDPDKRDGLTIGIESQSPGNRFNVTGTQLFSDTTFDAEAGEYYVITFKVTDGTHNATSNTLIINVGDVNDVDPVITPAGVTTQNIIVSTAVGTVLQTYGATDGDISSPNKDVTFSLSGAGSEKFEIDSTSGSVKLASQLDFSTQSSYSLVVTATDGGTPARSATATFSVNVDTTPIFVGLPANSTINIAENFNINNALYRISVSDPDNRKELIYSIVSQSPDNILTVNKNGLYSTKEFDAEAHRTYQVVFGVTDQVHPSVQSEKLTIVIDDVNDKKPVISTTGPMNVTIIDSSPIGSVIKTFAVTDDDVTSPNNVATFYEDTGSLKFRMDPISGHVKTQDTLDYSQQSSYNLTIRAADGGTPANVATVHLIVNLKTAPRFVDLNVDKSISRAENHAINTALYTVEAVDPDSSAKLNYAIVSQSPEPNRFYLGGANNNNLYTTTPFDVESVSQYELVFSVNDTEYSAVSKKLTVVITDVNDNGPVFVELPANDYVEHTPVGKYLFAIRATDADTTSPNNQVTYRMSGANVDYFWLDQSTGDITLVKAFNINTVKVFTLTLEAWDGGVGGTQKKTEKIVTFNITRDPVPSVVVPRGWIAVTLKDVRLNISCPFDLYQHAKYETVRIQLIAMWNKRQPSRTHYCFNIRCGSLLHDVTVVTKDNDSVQEDLQYLFSGGTLDYDGQTAAVSSLNMNNYTFSNSQPDKAALLCGLHTEVEPCPADSPCIVEDGRASCKTVTNDNFGILIGTMAAILAILFLVLLGVLAYFLSQRRTKRAREKMVRHSERSEMSQDFGAKLFPLREGRGWYVSSYDNYQPRY